jgi:ABC-type multidrug transport system ATPase subunit
VGGIPAVVSTDLTKRFRHQVVVDHIDLEVPSGAVYGFLGPNGSGKTTTIRMLLGLLSATEGRIELLGESMPGAVGSVLRRVGALVEGPAFHPYLSGRANLARLDAADRFSDPRTAAARINQVLERVGLLAAATKRYRAYSLGMRQRLAIANALLMPRDLLVLDEPTNGLDPPGIRWMRDLLRDEARRGRAVVVSSHLLAEVAQSVDDVVVIARGRLRAGGPLARVLGSSGGPLTRVRTTEGETLAAALRERGIGVEPGADGALHAAATTERVGTAAFEVGVPVLELTAVSRSLEEAFFALTEEAD